MTDNTSKVVQYRKRPVVIEAVQWHKPGDHPKVERFLDTAEGIEKWSRAMANAWGDHATEFHGIQTLEGTMRVSPGDWIIKGVKGEFYPCKPDIFAATYEPAAHPSRGVVHVAMVKRCDLAWSACGPDTSREEVVRRILQAAALPAVPDDWVSVSERLPEEGVLVLVYVPDADGERFDQDYIEDGAWAIHNEYREHYLAVGGPAAAGSDVVCTGPSEGAPYTHWKPLRAPAATPAHDQPEGEW